MAGGGIIVAQRQRANQYTGHFTRFTAVAILAAATTGLVESQHPICQHSETVATEYCVQQIEEQTGLPDPWCSSCSSWATTTVNGQTRCYLGKPH